MFCLFMLFLSEYVGSVVGSDNQRSNGVVCHKAPQRSRFFFFFFFFVVVFRWLYLFFYIILGQPNKPIS